MADVYFFLILCTVLISFFLTFIHHSFCAFFALQNIYIYIFISNLLYSRLHLIESLWVRAIKRLVAHFNKAAIRNVSVPANIFDSIKQLILLR